MRSLGSRHRAVLLAVTLLNTLLLDCLFEFGDLQVQFADGPFLFIDNSGQP